MKVQAIYYRSFIHSIDILFIEMIGIEAADADLRNDQGRPAGGFARQPLQPVRVGIIQINRRTLELGILVCIILYLSLDSLIWIVKIAGLTAQLVAVFIVVAETPVTCIVFGVLAFLLGIIEGWLAFARAFWR